jgi:hypothetical protein
MGAYLSTENKTIEIYGFVYADSLEEAKLLISQEFGPGFDLSHCREKEYPIIII